MWIEFVIRVNSEYIILRNVIGFGSFDCFMYSFPFLSVTLLKYLQSMSMFLRLGRLLALYNPSLFLSFDCV